MQLTTKELLKITTILLQYAEKRGKHPIQFSNADGYYQKIWHKDRSLKSIPEYSIGDLDDDIEDLREVLRGEDIIGYEFQRLGAVLMAFGSVVAHNDPSYNILRVNGKPAPCLSVKQLIRIAVLLVGYVEKVHKCTAISFDDDDSYYQRIRLDDRDFRHDPKITAGNVNDDMQQFKEILEKKRKPNPYDLERLGAVYNSLGSILPF